MDNLKARAYFLVIILCAGILFLTATKASAFNNCVYLYEALIDIDNNAGTGGPVTVVQDGESPHDIPGIDYIVRVYLAAGDTPKQIIETLVEKWDEGSSNFTLVSSNTASYNLGIMNGSPYDGSNADVVEFMASRADLGNPAGPMRIVYHASIGGFNDYTGPFNYPQSTIIPTLSEWGMIVLSLLLGVAALLLIKKRNSKAIMLLSSFLVVLSITGIVSANLTCVQKICLDGLVEDWNEIAATPSVLDPVGDSSIGDPGEDIVAGYITSDANNIYFRVDIVGGDDPSCE
jgi:hypothetical protein